MPNVFNASDHQLTIHLITAWEIISDWLHKYASFDGNVSYNKTRNVTGNYPHIDRRGQV